LRWRFKEKRQHGRRTQAKQKKLLLSATHPSSTNFLTKTLLLFPPAARGGKMARDVSKDYMSFSSIRFEARHGMK
jgi:hypothetical protein